MELPASSLRPFLLSCSPGEPDAEIKFKHWNLIFDEYKIFVEEDEDKHALLLNNISTKKL